MADDRTLRVRFLADVNSYLDGVRKAGAATANFGKEVTGQGKAVKADMEKVGRASLVLAGGLGLALGASAKAAIDWESAWAGVEKTVDGTAAELGALEDGLRNLATELPATHQEIAAVAEAAGQLGIARDDILDFTEVMIALGETTNLTADEAATSIAQLMNIMKTAPGDVDNLASALVDLGNNGASTERDIIEMSQRLAGAGRMIGASEQEVLALASAMADLGIQSQLGGGAMSRQLRNINSAVMENGSDLKKWARIANVSTKEFADAWRDSPAKAMDLLAKGLGRVRDAGGDVAATLKEVGVKGTQDLDVLGRLAGAGDRISKSLDISNDAWEKNVALQEEAAKRYGTTESKMQVTRNKVNDLAIAIGSHLLPIISKALDLIGGLANVFSGLPGFVQGGIVALGGVATVVAGVVGVVGTLAPKVKALDAALESMGMQAGFASRNMGTLARLAGKAFTALAVYQGVTFLTDMIDPKDIANVDKMQQALLDLADTGRVSGELADTLGEDFDDLGRAIERVADPSTATKLKNFIDATTLWGGTTDLEQARQRIDDLDKALAALAQQDPGKAAASLEAVKDAIGDDQFAKLLPLLDDYEVSLAALDVAGRTAAGGFEEVTNAAGVSEDALEDLADAVDAIFNSLYGVEAAADQFQQGLNDLDDVMKQAVEEGLKLSDVLGDQSDGALTLRGHLRDVANDAAAVVQEWVEQGIAGQELTNRIDGLSASFEEQMRKAGLPQPVIEHYLALLRQVPDQVNTTIGADTSQATAALAAFRAAQEGRNIVIGVQTRAMGAVKGLFGSTGGQVPQYRAFGGPAYGPKGTDTVPAWLTPGEFVMSRPAVNAIGLPTLDAMNRGRAIPTAASHGGASVNVTLHVAGSVHSKESLIREVEHGLRLAIRSQGGDVQQVLGQ